MVMTLIVPGADLSLLSHKALVTLSVIKDVDRHLDEI